MISATEMFAKQVSDLTLQVRSSNAKITTLTEEVAQLKREMVMMKVHAQLEATGHGGTVITPPTN